MNEVNQPNIKSKTYKTMFGHNRNQTGHFLLEQVRYCYEAELERFFVSLEF